MLGRVVQANFVGGTTRQPHAEFHVLGEDGLYRKFSEAVSQQRGDLRNQHPIVTRPLPFDFRDPKDPTTVIDTLEAVVERIERTGVGKSTSLEIKPFRGNSRSHGVIWAYTGNPGKEKNDLPTQIRMGTREQGKNFTGFIYTPSRNLKPKSVTLSPRELKAFYTGLNGHFPGCSFDTVRRGGLHIVGTDFAKSDLETLARHYGDMFMISSVLSRKSFTTEARAEAYADHLKRWDFGTEYTLHADFNVVQRTVGRSSMYFVLALTNRQGLHGLEEKFDTNHVVLSAASYSNDSQGSDCASELLRMRFPLGWQVDLDKQMAGQECWDPVFPSSPEEAAIIVKDLAKVPWCAIDLERTYIEGSDHLFGRTIAAVRRSGDGEKHMLLFRPDLPSQEGFGYELEAFRTEEEMMIRLNELRQWDAVVTTHYGLGYDYKLMGWGAEVPHSIPDLGRVRDRSRALQAPLDTEEERELFLDVGGRLEDHENLKKKGPLKSFPRSDFERYDSHGHGRYRTAVRNGLSLEGFVGEAFKGLTHAELEQHFRSMDAAEFERFVEYTAGDGDQEFELHQTMLNWAIAETMLWGGRPLSDMSAHKPAKLAELAMRRKYFMETGTHWRAWDRSRSVVESELEDQIALHELMLDKRRFKTDLWAKRPHNGDGVGLHTGIEVSLPTLFIDAAMPVIETHPGAMFIYEKMMNAPTAMEQINYWSALQGFLTPLWNDVAQYMNKRRLETGRNDIAIGQIHHPAHLYLYLEDEATSPEVIKQIARDNRDDYRFGARYGALNISPSSSVEVATMDGDVEISNRRLVLNNLLGAQIPRYASATMNRIFLFGNDLPGLVLSRDANVMHARNGTVKSAIWIPDNSVAGGEFLYAGFLGTGKMPECVLRDVQTVLRTGRTISCDWDTELREDPRVKKDEEGGLLRDYAYIANALAVSKREEQPQLSFTMPPLELDKLDPAYLGGVLPPASTVEATHHF